MSECKHNFQHQGLVYGFGNTIPGSGAREVIYHDRYFCSACLETVDKNKRVVGNSYNKPIEGSVPE